ncbi:MAG: hypothetical protein Ta2B_30880 [Termitinemataceae bacterium]|nr:MAG: hypothetical protein Ta2B_30880 [Termitinemataceae bacterium]
MKKDILANPKNVKFIDLLQICIKYFGNPRISGSHHIFKMPWQGDPRINIQKDGNMAKEYQHTPPQAAGLLFSRGIALRCAYPYSAAERRGMHPFGSNQVKAVVNAIEKLQHENNKTEEKKHGKK